MKAYQWLAIATTALFLAGCKHTGSGEKVGQVTRVVGDNGVFCPTMEVEIIRGGMSAGTGVMGAPFHVTVEPGHEKDYAFLVKAMEDRREVKIKYRKEFVTFCRSDSDQNAFLVSVEYADAASLPVAPVSIEGPVAVAPAASGAVVGHETRDQKVQRLLKLQAELLQELAAGQK